jgi:LAS superfamily LD-carboxypeptidase LdcB
VNAAELTGRARTHVTEVPRLQSTMHRDAVTAFTNLVRAAGADGFEVCAVSAFRDFDRQLAIWNGKYSGERPTQGVDGRPLAVECLAPEARIEAILRWSALPGASRHHWGTDFDLADRNALEPGRSARLTPDEYAPGGPFAALSAWLEEHAARFGFFRPYRGVKSAVQAEPWHFSFAPLAEFARRRLTEGVLRDVLAAAPLLGKESVLAGLPDYHARYVAAIDVP